jgi:hypothetical protein
MLYNILNNLISGNFVNFQDLFLNYHDLFRIYCSNGSSVIPSNSDLVAIEDFYTGEFDDLFVKPEMIDYYSGINSNYNYNQSVPEIRIIIAEENNDLQNHENINNSRFSIDVDSNYLQNPDIINMSRFSIDEEALYERNYNFYNYYIISGVLSSITIITVIAYFAIK